MVSALVKLKVLSEVSLSTKLYLKLFILILQVINWRVVVDVKIDLTEVVVVVVVICLIVVIILFDVVTALDFAVDVDDLTVLLVILGDVVIVVDFEVDVKTDWLVVLVIFIEAGFVVDIETGWIVKTLVVNLEDDANVLGLVILFVVVDSILVKPPLLQFTWLAQLQTCKFWSNSVPLGQAIKTL